MTGLEKTGFGRFRGLLSAKAGTAPDEPDVAVSSPDESRQTRLLIRNYEECGLGWFWSTDEKGRITYISDTVAQALGGAREDLGGQMLQNVFAMADDDGDKRERTLPLPLLLNAHKKFSNLLIKSARPGSEALWRISGRPQFSESGEFEGYLGNGNVLDGSEIAERNDSHKAIFDTLTGLFNRDHITKRLDTTLKSYCASKRSCAIMLLDLDRFKQVNDTLGHPAGDALLKQVAERLRQVFKGSCEIGRPGGDEFQIILPDCDDRGELGEQAKKIISMLSQPFSLDEGRCMIGASVGIAIAPYDGLDRESLIRSADLALYAAKAGGRGQFRFYSADLRAEAERRRQIKAELGDALAREQMFLAYEPRVDSANTVVGLQATVRWEHPDFSEIPADIFWPMAYESNLVIPIVEWSLRQACADAIHWPDGVKLALCVPIEQFKGKDVAGLIKQALNDADLAPERLEIEVAETIFTGDYDNIKKQLMAIKMHGVRLILDDFGTGYASLGHLRDALFDEIKISQCFVRQIEGETKTNEPIVTAIVSLARAMNMQTVAVGADSLSELETLRRLDVDKVQGGVFSDAVIFEDVMDAMDNGSWLIEPNGPSRSRSERRSVLRNVGLIHEDYRYELRMRNLSRTGCLIEGLQDVPLGEQFVVDFGGGQLAVALVTRSVGAQQGLEFELPLVDDGAGGLVTRNRISPYALAAAGMPLEALPSGSYPLSQLGGAQMAIPQAKFLQVEK